jgi:hypothetical protein
MVSAALLHNGEVNTPLQQLNYNNRRAVLLAWSVLMGYPWDELRA